MKGIMTIGSAYGVCREYNEFTKKEGLISEPEKYYIICADTAEEAQELFRTELKKSYNNFVYNFDDSDVSEFMDTVDKSTVGDDMIKLTDSGVHEISKKLYDDLFDKLLNERCMDMFM